MAPRELNPCPICDADVYSLAVSSKSCTSGHGLTERACKECWEAHLSQEVEEKAPGDVQCMFCPSKPGLNNIVGREELQRLARKGTLERYDEKLKDSTHRQCGQRCWASKRDTSERNSPSVLQPFNRETDGRVFTCKLCDFATCTDCDRPEHTNETCAAYRARVIQAPSHHRAEHATAARFPRCPNATCAAIWDWDPAKGKGCGYTVCSACKFRFCGNCMIPWVGEGSAYLGGKMAHGDGCRYRRKDAESRYSLGKRFKPGEEVEERLAKKAEVKKERQMEKKRKREAGEEGGEGSEAAERGSKGKKRKVH